MEDGFSLRKATVGVIGLGLMGGSLAMGLSGKCARLIGLDVHRPTVEQARLKGVVDWAIELPEGASQSFSLPSMDLVILAAPVPAILSLLRRLPEWLAAPCVVLDIGSTKRDIVRAMNDLPPGFDPIGGHPICGREQLGLEHADPALYRNAPFVLTPLERTTPRARSAAGQVVHVLGAQALELDADEHDRLLAATSHLPFLLASALSQATPAEAAPLIGPGFRSTARLAGTPASMMSGVLLSNRDYLLQALRRFRLTLDALEAALQQENSAALHELLDASRTTYLALVSP